MKTAKLLIMTFLISFMMFGCDSGWNSGSSSKTKTTPLDIGVRTEVNSGDVYHALSADALVTFEQNTTTNIRYLTLTQGQGELITAVQ